MERARRVHHQPVVFNLRAGLENDLTHRVCKIRRFPDPYIALDDRALTTLPGNYQRPRVCSYRVATLGRHKHKMDWRGTIAGGDLHNCAVRGKRRVQSREPVRLNICQRAESLTHTVRAETGNVTKPAHDHTVLGDSACGVLRRVMPVHKDQLNPVIGARSKRR